MEIRKGDKVRVMHVDDSEPWFNSAVCSMVGVVTAVDGVPCVRVEFPDGQVWYYPEEYLKVLGHR